MRQEIYQTLKEANSYVSGEALSASLGVTRAALWKHIKAMQSDGAEIESVTGQGYRLICPPRVPRAQYLAAHVNADIGISFRERVTSTNEVAKQAALADPGLIAVFIAGEQTAGKGRKGRSWQSTGGEGVYMSFLLRPDLAPEHISGITLMASVAVCEAIEQTSGAIARIKWPNDILVGSKKAVGILTESMIGMDGVDYVVCGIGINTGTARFQGELAQKAVSLRAFGDVNEMLLTAAVIHNFMAGYQLFLEHGLAPFMQRYRSRSALSGRVTVIAPGGECVGEFEGFGDDGALLVRCGSDQKRFVAGEVSLRGENGYV